MTTTTHTISINENIRIRANTVSAKRVSKSRLDPEDQILRDEEDAGLTPEELADGQAQFDATFPILTRPGESLIDTVAAARLADEKEGEFEAYNNDMK